MALSYFDGGPRLTNRADTLTITAPEDLVHFHPWWSPYPIHGVAVAVTLALASGCAATPTARLRMVPAEGGPVVRLAEARLSPGSDCVVGLTSGGLVRGRLVRLDVDAVVIDARRHGGDANRRVIDAEIASIGRVVGRSKPGRAWIGAVAGALLSLPLSISMPGDGIVVGGLIGGAAGRATGDARIEIVLHRGAHSGLGRGAVPGLNPVRSAAGNAQGTGAHE